MVNTRTLGLLVATTKRSYTSADDAAVDDDDVETLRGRYFTSRTSSVYPASTRFGRREGLVEDEREESRDEGWEGEKVSDR